MRWQDKLKDKDLSPNGVDRRILVAKDCYCAMPPKPEFMLRNDDDAGLLDQMMVFAAKLRVDFIQKHGRSPEWVGVSVFPVMMNRYFTVRLRFFFTEHDNGTVTVRLDGEQLNRVEELERQVKMFLN